MLPDAMVYGTLQRKVETVNFGRNLLNILVGAALLGTAAPGFAEAPVRFEPAVMTPSAHVQYVDVAKRHRHHHRRHRKSAAHYNRHAQVITSATTSLC